MSFKPQGKQTLRFKSGHDNGIFTLSVEGHIVATIDAYRPSNETNWWTAVELPVECDGELVVVNVTGAKHPRSTNSYVQIVGLASTAHGRRQGSAATTAVI